MSAMSRPVPTPEQTLQGRLVYTRLAMVMQKYQDWFKEGVPHEWVGALDEIQQILTQCKREAAQAAKAGTPRAVQADLFAAGEEGGCARRETSGSSRDGCTTAR